MPLLEWSALHGATIESSLVGKTMVFVVKCVGRTRTFYIHDYEPFHWDLFSERHGNALESIRRDMERPDTRCTGLVPGFRTCSNEYCEQCHENRETA